MATSSVPRTDRDPAQRVTQHVEWPTLGLIGAFHMALVVLVGWHDRLPWPVAFVLFVLILGVTIVQTRIGRRYEWL